MMNKVLLKRSKLNSNLFSDLKIYIVIMVCIQVNVVNNKHNITAFYISLYLQPIKNILRKLVTPCSIVLEIIKYKVFNFTLKLFNPTKK